MSDTNYTRDFQSDGTLGELSGAGVGVISGGVVGAGVGGPLGAVLGAVLGGALGAAAGGAAHEIGADVGPGHSDAGQTGPWDNGEAELSQNPDVSSEPGGLAKTVFPDPESGLPGLSDGRETIPPPGSGPDILGP